MGGGNIAIKKALSPHRHVRIHVHVCAHSQWATEHTTDVMLKSFLCQPHPQNYFY